MCTYMSARVRNRTEVIFTGAMAQQRRDAAENLGEQLVYWPRAGSVCVEEDVESLVSMAACVDGP